MRYDFASNTMKTVFSPKIDFPFTDYETVQEFYYSKDGTKVPLFITKRKGLIKDGSHPTVLYGYGGYNATRTPSFSVQVLAWLEQGGIHAEPCLRGGAEYGEAWHRAGMLESKQNTFDDMITASEYLIKEGYTQTAKLGIMGRSNGGLLTGACVTQRPDLFGAVIVWVPVLDMLRYHLFTAGRLWTGEYGNAENPEQFPFMYKYSPLHNVKMSTVYPPTLIMTADTDDRVVPSQARKFAATMQAADAGDNPIYIRIEKAAGHGQGKPIGKLIAEQTDLYTFFTMNLCRPTLKIK
jgi:prolyl oligopeptidase